MPPMRQYHKIKYTIIFITKNEKLKVLHFVMLINKEKDGAF